MNLNIIGDAWIPVRRKDGSRAVIAPWQIADDTLVFPDWPRPDLNIACLELLIGLVFMADPPRDRQDWRQRRAPDPDRLREKLAPYAPAFNLLGDGPRFMQDLERLEEGAKEIAHPTMLFIDSGGENTFGNNSDIFVKRSRYETLDFGTSAIALYATQIYAYADSSKHQSSLRRNGPIVTLVDEGRGLWSLVWANTPYSAPLTIDALEELPWCHATTTSESRTGSSVFPRRGSESALKYHVETFFSVPWRMRLVAEGNSISGFARKDFGTRYEGWMHPLTPYRREDPCSRFEPVKAQPQAANYKNWLGVLASKASSSLDLRRRAEVLDLWSDREGRQVDVIVAGWAMAKAKPRDFIFSRAPLVTLGDDTIERMEALVEAASKFALALRSELEVVLPKGSANTRLEVAKEAAREDFYIRTQSAFETCLGTLSGETADWPKIADSWRDTLHTVALAIFDDLALPGLADRDVKVQQEIVSARRNLTGAFAGYGKLGGQAFVVLGLPEPEQGGKKKRKAS